MNTSQINRLEKIVQGFAADKQLCDQLDDRHTELNDAVPDREIKSLLSERMKREGVRAEIIDLVLDGFDAEQAISSFIETITGMIARYEMADHIDSARDAA